jgi:hypothetical protein
MNIKEFDPILRGTRRKKRCSVTLPNGNQLQIKRINDLSFAAWLVAYRWVPMGQLKYQFDESGELIKVAVQIRLFHLLGFTLIPIVIAIGANYCEEQNLQYTIDAWPFYLGVVAFAVLMQIMGLIITKYQLPKQIETLIKQSK